MTMYAYARVSSKDQNLSRQLESFKKLNINQSHIYCDKQSGKDFERENYQKLIKKLKINDVLVIKSIDRLGRNYDMIIEEWHKITKVIGANIVVLDMELLDTRDKSSNLTGKLISEIVLQLLSYVAEIERANIKQRQSEGIKIAKEKGVIFGRPKKSYEAEFLEILNQYSNHTISLETALNQLHMKRSTFYYHLKSIRNLQQSIGQ